MDSGWIWNQGGARGAYINVEECGVTLNFGVVYSILCRLGHGFFPWECLFQNHVHVNRRVLFLYLILIFVLLGRLIDESWKMNKLDEISFANFK